MNAGVACEGVHGTEDAGGAGSSLLGLLQESHAGPLTLAGRGAADQPRGRSVVLVGAAGERLARHLHDLTRLAGVRLL